MRCNLKSGGWGRPHQDGDMWQRPKGVLGAWEHHVPADRKQVQRPWGGGMANVVTEASAAGTDEEEKWEEVRLEVRGWAVQVGAPEWTLTVTLSDMVASFPGEAITNYHNLVALNKEIYPLTVVAAKSLKSKCWLCWFLLEVLREDSSHASPPAFGCGRQPLVLPVL